MEAFISQPLMATPLDGGELPSTSGFSIVPPPAPQAAPQAPPAAPAPAPAPAPALPLAEERRGRFGSTEMRRYMSLALLIAIGLSIHWAGSFYVEDMVADLDGMQQTLARIGYPAALALAFWHLRSNL